MVIKDLNCLSFEDLKIQNYKPIFDLINREEPKVLKQFSIKESIYGYEKIEDTKIDTWIKSLKNNRFITPIIFGIVLSISFASLVNILKIYDVVFKTKNGLG